MDKENEEILRARMEDAARKSIEKGDFYGWFDRIYRETEGDSSLIPWVDFEPNRFLLEWDKTAGLGGTGESALVVGCGLGDEARFLDERGFRVTAFDVSEKAIEIAKKVSAGTGIEFVTADLFAPPDDWREKFSLVVEVYTIQALPLSLREKAIAAVSSFVAENGRLIVVQRLGGKAERENGPPWAFSKDDLAGFEKNGLTPESFSEYDGDEEEPVRRFVAEFIKKSGVG